MANDMQVGISTSADIVTARQRGRELASELGFSGSDLTVLATAISEVARNIIEHAKEGEVILEPTHNGSKQGILIIASDRGPGIPDVDRALQDGYSSGKGLGLGLPGAKRLMDEFKVVSEVGKGTTVTMKKWVR
ncbi:MAG: anti-sigma regulatory factor [Nitrospirae bacterium]|nr:anti-sigma regulatory factor [Nitrospirota bacterium]